MKSARKHILVLIVIGITPIATYGGWGESAKSVAIPGYGIGQLSQISPENHHDYTTTINGQAVGVSFGIEDDVDQWVEVYTGDADAFIYFPLNTSDARIVLPSADLAMGGFNVDGARDGDLPDGRVGSDAGWVGAAFDGPTDTGVSVSAACGVVLQLSASFLAAIFVCMLLKAVVKVLRNLQGGAGSALK